MNLQQFLVRTPTWAEALVGGLAALAVAVGASVLGADVLAQAATFTIVVVGFFALVFLRLREVGQGPAPATTAATATTATTGTRPEVTWRDAIHRAPSLLELLVTLVALWTAVYVTEAADLGGVLEVVTFVGAFVLVSAAFTVHDKLSGGRWRPTPR